MCKEDDLWITVEWDSGKTFTYKHVVKVIYAFTKTENCLILHFCDRSKKTLNNISDYYIN